MSLNRVYHKENCSFITNPSGTRRIIHALQYLLTTSSCKWWDVILQLKKISCNKEVWIVSVSIQHNYGYWKYFWSKLKAQKWILLKERVKTSNIHNGSSVAKPSSRATGKIYSIWWVIGFCQRHKAVVIATIRQWVTKNEVTGDFWFSMSAEL